MNFDKQVEQFLIENKSIALQGIGKFFIEPPDENNTEKGNILFEYDSKIKTDEAFIQFLAQDSKRMKALVAADVESYLNLIKQFLNIAKPYLFPGIGVLTKTNQGEFIFHEKNNFKSTLLFSKTDENNEESIVEVNTNRNKFIIYSLMVIVILTIISGVGWGIYNWLSNSKEKNITELPIQKTTVNTAIIQKDSISRKPIADSLTQKFVVGIIRYRTVLFNELNELNRTGFFAFHDTIFIRDSLRYRLMLNYKYPKYDTATILNTLQQKFQFPVYSLQ